MLVNNVRYNYSYILLNNSLKNDIKEYNKIEIKEWTLYYSFDMDIEVYNKESTQLVLIGYAMDIRDGTLTTYQILENLAQSENIDQSLDFINGRYILVADDSDVTVYTDASALLPINYSFNKDIIASHDVMIKDILELNQINVEYENEKLKGSFDFTRYKDIFKFNPSLKLDLNKAEFSRIYPIQQMAPKSIELIVEELDLYIREMVTWLNDQNNKIVLTLTGGYDSRVSMALTKNINHKIEYITYMHPNINRLSERAQEIYNIDKFITESIARNLNVNHTMVDLSDYKLKGKDREYFKHVLQSSHSFPLIAYFKDGHKFNKVLHIKSTVFGMGKSDFPLKSNHNPETFDEMANFIHGVSKDVMNSPNFKPLVSDYFKRNHHYKGVGKGRHYFEIFHLESRMGNWHSNITQETDPELLDFIFVNTRRILDLIQSPSIQERKDKILYKKLIHKYWPALLFIGFNEEEYMIDYDKVGLNNKYINGLKIYESKNLNVDFKDGGEILIRPVDEYVGPQNQYIFKVKNNTHFSKSLTIKSFFNKESGRKYINIKIMKLDNKTFKSIDIVDLYEGYDVTLDPFKELMIRIDYNYVFNKTSWQQAGRIQISNI